MRFIATLFIILFINSFSYAEWTNQRLQNLTNEIQKTVSTWTHEQTIKIVNESKNCGQSTTMIVGDKGNVGLTIMGETVLINGKDISGNLGSKTTYGNNSPIIDNVENSQISTGNNSPIIKTQKSNKVDKGTIVENVSHSQITTGDKSNINKDVSSNFTLSIPLPVSYASLVINILGLVAVLYRKHLKRHQGVHKNEKKDGKVNIK